MIHDGPMVTLKALRVPEELFRELTQEKKEHHQKATEDEFLEHVLVKGLNQLRAERNALGGSRAERRAQARQAREAHKARIAGMVRNAEDPVKGLGAMHEGGGGMHFRPV